MQCCPVGRVVAGAQHHQALAAPPPRVPATPRHTVASDCVAPGSLVHAASGGRAVHVATPSHS